jgi:hypothetical protein
MRLFGYCFCKLNHIDGEVLIKDALPRSWNYQVMAYIRKLFFEHGSFALHFWWKIPWDCCSLSEDIVTNRSLTLSEDLSPGWHRS